MQYLKSFMNIMLLHFDLIPAFLPTSAERALVMQGGLDF